MKIKKLSDAMLARCIREPEMHETAWALTAFLDLRDARAEIARLRHIIENADGTDGAIFPPDQEPQAGIGGGR